MKQTFFSLLLWASMLSPAFSTSLPAQSLEDKLSGKSEAIDDFTEEMSQKLKKVDEEVRLKRLELANLYRQAQSLSQLSLSTELQLAEFESPKLKEFIVKIQQIRREISHLEESWRMSAAASQEEELYALWDQPEVTLSQLIMDYGSQNFVYLIPPDIGALKLSINSRLPIPKASWEEMIEMILSQNGVGVRQLNPYLRELYNVKQVPSQLYSITHQRQELDLMPAQARAAFLICPKVTEAERVVRFLESFSHKQKTDIRLIGHKIIVVSTVQEIKELLKIYDFAAFHYEGQDFRLVTLSRVSAGDAAKILETLFSSQDKKGESSLAQMGAQNEGKSELKRKEGPLSLNVASGFRLIALEQPAQSLFLMGTKEELDRAQEILQFIEKQAGHASEKVVHWYLCRHSDAEELAKVLEQVYELLKQTEGSTLKKEGPKISFMPDQRKDRNYDWDRIAVPPIKIGGQSDRTKKSASSSGNFIVDAKTGSIVMVVEADALDKIKEVLKRLDVPKKMVQIEVLLFEKKVNDSNEFGLNLLRLGQTATNTNAWGARWNEKVSTSGSPPVTTSTLGTGILDYTFSSMKRHGVPAFDLAYSFLLSQKDVQVNACPSVITVNQTPATIAIVDEISLNNGAVLDDSNKNAQISYTRTQYGISIEITPTIHAADEEGIFKESFITLDTDIKFESMISGSDASRPDIAKRNIKNQVRIKDKETVILGGLRSKKTNDSKDATPFLGEIPGLGKLFSMTKEEDELTEMFIFLTPKIIADAEDEREQMRLEMLQRRPGDFPELLREVLQAKERNQRHLVEGSLRALFGRHEVFYEEPKEYDGR